MISRRISLALFVTVLSTISVSVRADPVTTGQDIHLSQPHFDAIIAGDAPRSVSDLAAGLLDAVVNISTTQSVKGSDQSDDIVTPKIRNGSPFQKYFDEFFNHNNDDNQNFSRKVESLGSGFVIDAKNGLIVTNNHVIDNADEIEAIFTDGSKLKAKLLGKDSKTDLALLQVAVGNKHLKEVQFGDSDNVRIGDWVMAVGNPFGFGGSVTVGIISARNRDINSGPYDDFFQTDAAINRGNSGGPLFDMSGKVIGINTAIVSPSGGSIGIGFAIPSDLAVSVIDQLKTFGETRRGWLAIRIRAVTEELARTLNLKNTHGALVAAKMQNANVDNSALQPGDVIVSFNNKPIKEARDLPRLVGESSANQMVDIDILRNGVEKTVKVKLGLLDDNEHANKNDMQQKPASNDESSIILGMKLKDLTADLRKRYAVSPKLFGVIINDVIPNSIADQRRLHAGEVIVSIEQENVLTVEKVKKRLDDLRGQGRKSVLMVIADPEGELHVVTMDLD